MHLFLAIITLTFSSGATSFVYTKNKNYADVNDSINEYLYDSNSKIKEANKLLPKLEEVYNKNQPWASKNVPFWLKMANQALYLEYERYKNEKKFLIKLELAKKLPYTRNMTNFCLSNPWSDNSNCDFDKLNKNIKLLCLIDNTNIIKIESKLDYFRMNPNKSYYKYDLFCWIIYLINYVEQCQLNLLIDEINCSLNNIEIFLKLIIKKINFTKENDGYYLNNNLKSIYEFYFDIAKERSMQLLIQILLLFNSSQDNPKLFETRLNFERILNYLLNDHVEKETKYDLLYKVSNKSKQFQISMKLIDKKVKSLFEYSTKIILKHAFNLIKYIKY